MAPLGSSIVQPVTSYPGVELSSVSAEEQRVRLWGGLALLLGAGALAFTWSVARYGW